MTVAVGLLIGAGVVVLVFGGDDGKTLPRASRTAPADTRIVVGPDLSVQPAVRRVLIKQGDDAISPWRVNAYRDSDHLLCVEIVRPRSASSMSTCGDTLWDPDATAARPVFGQFVLAGDGGRLVLGAVRSDVARVRIESNDGTHADEATPRNALGTRFFVADLGMGNFDGVTRTAFDAKGKVLEHTVDPPSTRVQQMRTG